MEMSALACLELETETFQPQETLEEKGRTAQANAVSFLALNALGNTLPSISPVSLARTSSSELATLLSATDSKYRLDLPNMVKLMEKTGDQNDLITKGWDVVSSYSADKLNSLLQKRYEENKLISTVDISTIVEVPIINEKYNAKLHLSLGAPSLSFDSETDNCILRIPIEEGSSTLNDTTKPINAGQYQIVAKTPLKSMSGNTGKVVDKGELIQFVQGKNDAYHIIFHFANAEIKVERVKEGEDSLLGNLDMQKSIQEYFRKSTTTYDGVFDRLNVDKKTGVSSNFEGYKFQIGKDLYIATKDEIAGTKHTVTLKNREDTHTLVIDTTSNTVTLDGIAIQKPNKAIEVQRNSELSYALTALNNNSTKENLNLTPNSFIFHSEGSGSDGILSLFIETTTSGNHQRITESKNLSLRDVNGKAVSRIPSGQEYSLVISKNLLSTFIRSQISEAGYSASLLEEGKGIHFRVKFPPNTKVTQGTPTGNTVFEHYETLNMDLSQSTFSLKFEDGKAICNGSYTDRLNWHKGVPIIAYKRGGADVTLTLSKTSPIQLTSTDKSSSIELIEISSKDFSIDVEKGWGDQPPGDVYSVSRIEELINIPKIPKIDVGSIGYFAVENIMFPDKDAVEIDHTVGVQTPSDFMLVGKIKNK